MAPYQTNNFDPGYYSASGNLAFKNFDVYNDRHDRIGIVVDGLQDAAGSLQYLVIVLSTWVPGKQVLIPINQVQVDVQTQRLYAIGLSQQQVMAVPAYNAAPMTNPQPQKPAKQVYRMRSLEDSAPLESSAPLEGYSVFKPSASSVTSAEPVPPVAPPMAQDSVLPHSYPVASQIGAVPQPPVQNASVPSNQPPMTPPRHPRPVSSPTQPPADIEQETVIPLREERLIVEQKKQKIGEVVVRKEIETEIVEVPIQREKLIVEQVGNEPKQLAEIDLTDEDLSNLSLAQRREAQLPNISRQEPFTNR